MENIVFVGDDRIDGKWMTKENLCRSGLLDLHLPFYCNWYTRVKVSTADDNAEEDDVKSWIDAGPVSCHR